MIENNVEKMKELVGEPHAISLELGVGHNSEKPKDWKDYFDTNYLESVFSLAIRMPPALDDVTGEQTQWEHNRGGINIHEGYRIQIGVGVEAVKMAGKKVNEIIDAVRKNGSRNITNAFGAASGGNLRESDVWLEGEAPSDVVRTVKAIALLQHVAERKGRGESIDWIEENDLLDTAALHLAKLIGREFAQQGKSVFDRAIEKKK